MQALKQIPGYGEHEFLVCVDSQGNPVHVSKDILRNYQKTREQFPDFLDWFQEAKLPDQGDHTLLIARWLCHLLGYRHSVVHLFINHPVEKDCTLVQVRSMSKSEAPGCFDLPVGGHMSGFGSVLETLQKEISEELGLEPEDLCEMVSLGGYEFADIASKPGFHNVEYRYVYKGKIVPVQPGGRRVP